MAVRLTTGGPEAARWSGRTAVGAAAPARGIQSPKSVDDGVVREALGQLDALVGLRSVKTVIQELVAFALIQQQRQAVGLRAEAVVLHAIFRGSPGTGKTTTARILGRLFAGLGLLRQGHLVEVERADLVGEYVGHSAAKTKTVVQRALGGVLFVDEAYSLARGGERDFGREVTDVLVKAMEDHRSDFVLILAGYGDEMDRYLRTNPGLRSRFPLHLEFPNLLPAELVDVTDRMLQCRDYHLSPAARARVQFLLRSPGSAPALTTGNARLVRNLLERAMRRQAVRILRESGQLIPDGTLESISLEQCPNAEAPADRLRRLSELLPEDFDTSLTALAGL